MLPCWVIQVLILLSLMGLFSYRLSHTVNTWEEADHKGDVPVVEFVWAVANIAFSLISLVVTFVSIARFIAEVLTPLSLLFGAILNITLSCAVLALDIVIYVQRSDKNYSLIGLGLDAGLILFTIIPLIYAIIIYRRLLNYDDYHLPGNHKAFGFSSLEEGVEDRFSISHHTSPTPYDPTNPPSLGVTTNLTGGEPQTRGRSVSIGSRRISLSFARGASTSPHPSPPLETAGHERRTSYDHKRDTQFEEYIARRVSQNGGIHSRNGSYHSRSGSYNGSTFQDDVKRALGDEFGFGEEKPLGAAVQAAHITRPRASSLGRQTSHEALLGGLLTPTNGGTGGVSRPILLVTTPPEEGEIPQRGHSLNSVPEAREEEDHHHQANNAHVARKRAASESSRALLGDHDGYNQHRNNRRSVNLGGRVRPPRIALVEGLEDVMLEGKRRRRGP